MAEYQNIKFGVQDRMAVIAIDHPPANAFDRRTLAYAYAHACVVLLGIEKITTT